MTMPRRLLFSVAVANGLTKFMYIYNMYTLETRDENPLFAGLPGNGQSGSIRLGLSTQEAQMWRIGKGKMKRNWRIVNIYIYMSYIYEMAV